MLKRLWQDEAGGELAEYAVVGAILLVAAAAVLPGLADAIKTTFEKIKTALTGA